MVPTHRLKQRIVGKQAERTVRIEHRVGAELAHMLRKRVRVQLRVKVRKGAELPLTER